MANANKKTAEKAEEVDRTLIGLVGDQLPEGATAAKQSDDRENYEDSPEKDVEKKQRRSRRKTQSENADSDKDAKPKTKNFGVEIPDENLIVLRNAEVLKKPDWSQDLDSADNTIIVKHYFDLVLKRQQFKLEKESSQLKYTPPLEILDEIILEGLLLTKQKSSFMTQLAYSIHDAGIIFTKGNKKLKWDGDHFRDISPAFNKWLVEIAAIIGMPVGVDKPVKGTLSGDLLDVMGGIGAAIKPTALGSCPGIPCRNGFIYYDKKAGDWAISANREEHGNCSILQSTASDILDAKKDIVSDPERFKQTRLHSYLQLSLHDDQIEMIQNWLGLHLIFGNTQAKNNQRFMIMKGPGGDGKSQLLLMIIALMGISAVCETPIHKMKPTMYDHLAGKKAWAMDEVKADSLPLEELKSLTAGGVLTADPKFIPGYDIDMEALITMTMNREPNLSDKSDAIARRLILIEFTKMTEMRKLGLFDPSKSATSIGEEIAHNELPILAAWALVGAERIIKNNYVLPVPDSISKLSRDRAHESDSITDFANECLVSDYTSRVTMRELFNAYKEFCKKQGVNSNTYAYKNFVKEVNRYASSTSGQKALPHFEFVERMTDAEAKRAPYKQCQWIARTQHGATSRENVELDMIPTRASKVVIGVAVNINADHDEDGNPMPWGDYFRDLTPEMVAKENADKLAERGIVIDNIDDIPLPGDGDGIQGVTDGGVPF